MSRICARCGGWRGNPNHCGESQLYGSYDIPDLCEPCWLDEDQEIERLSTNRSTRSVGEVSRNSKERQKGKQAMSKYNIGDKVTVNESYTFSPDTWEKGLVTDKPIRFGQGVIVHVVPDGTYPYHVQFDNQQPGSLPWIFKASELDLVE